METNTIQATFTLTLTKEQLLYLLDEAVPAAAEQQIPVQIQPAPVQTAPMPTQTAPAPAPMQAVPASMPVQTQPAPIQPAPAPAPSPIPVQQPAPIPMQAAPAPMPVQTAQQTYSVQDLMLAARPLVENKRQQELLALLAEFGVNAVTAIPENRRADFAARLRALGGQI